jgi:uncharacterized protein
MPITIAITRKVRPGAHDDFERAVTDWMKQSVTFPGHLGVLQLRPADDGNEYGALLRFEDQAAWDRFKDWPPYKEFLTRIRPFIEEPAVARQLHGLEAFFAPDAPEAGAPLWKMAVVTWVGVSLTLLILKFTAIPFMSTWPWAASFLVTNALVVSGLTWLIMPLLVKAFRHWLAPTKRVERIK